MSEPRSVTYYLKFRLSDLEILDHPSLARLSTSALEQRLKQILRNVRSVRIAPLKNEAGYEVLVKGQS